MKEETKKIRNKWLHLRLDEEEFKLLNDNFLKSDERKLSRYARKVFLAQPINVVHRNGSIDELMATLVRVQKDLNGLGNNYNQMVHKLHLLQTDAEVKAWIIAYESEKQKLFNCIAEIKKVIAEGAKKWLR